MEATAAQQVGFGSEADDVVRGDDIGCLGVEIFRFAQEMKTAVAMRAMARIVA